MTSRPRRFLTAFTFAMLGSMVYGLISVAFGAPILLVLTGITALAALFATAVTR